MTWFLTFLLWSGGNDYAIRREAQTDAAACVTALEGIRFSPAPQSSSTHSSWNYGPGYGVLAVFCTEALEHSPPVEWRYRTQ